MENNLFLAAALLVCFEVSSCSSPSILRLIVSGSLRKCRLLGGPPVSQVEVWLI